MGSFRSLNIREWLFANKNVYKVYKENMIKQTRWRFEKADWDEFNKSCIDGIAF